ncbi:type IV secretion system DNA-binding domain-containing protein [Patescibacteria group bacterium]|nr:type IV secretion system DNA-binding domain-containing protein [Patescibacteria group bacterium]
MFKDIIPKSEKSKENKPEKKNTKYSSQQMGDLDKKTEDELYNVTIKALALSPHPHRIDIILNDLGRSMSQYGYVGLNSLNFSKVKADRIGEFTSSFVNRLFDNGTSVTKFTKRQLLNIKELSSIFHFPHYRFNRSPRIKWQTYKIVPAPDGIPQDGIDLGYNLFAGVKRVIKLKDKDRFRHFYIIGQTGTGKSSIMVTMLKQDIEQGRGCMVIDPHGELCETVMKYFPKERIDDLIYFDASNFEYPLGVNIFTAQTEDERNLIVSDLVDMFIGMYGHEIFGPRIQDYFSNAALTLMEQPEGGTLTEIVRMFTDPAFQKIKLKNVTNPVVRNRWEKTYASMGDREKGEMIPFFQAKFGPFITNSMIRNIIGQPKSSFDVSEAMQHNKVILVNLSKGLLGEFNSQLLGRMMVTQVKVAALRRAGMAEHERVPFYLYIDEMQNYVSKSIESVLSEARKYKLGMIMAHQYIDQLKQSNL